MPNIATILKSEISRIARKQVRVETAALKKTVARLRTEVSTLRQRAETSEKQLRGLAKAPRPAPEVSAEGAVTGKTRYSAKSLISQRRRLGLSARELGLLLGTSAQSIYNWEEGKARPRAKYLTAIAALRGLGRRTARAHLESLG